jgi:molybdenum cofactor guanylyltransferase
MGGRDKGLIELNGHPLVTWTLRALEPQVNRIAINANRNPDAYASLGFDVVADTESGYLGPLAGMAAGMRWANTSHILAVPCDSPLIVNDLASRLWQTADTTGAEICVAHDGARMQPVFALLRTSLLPSLEAFLENGGRKIDRWYGEHSCELADFSDCPDNFLNVNEPGDLAALETALADAAPGSGRAPENPS